LWSESILNPLDQFRNVLGNKALTSWAQWTKEIADWFKLFNDLLLGLVGGQILFNVGNNQLANRATSLLSFTFLKDDFSLDKGTETELGTELLWSVSSLNPFDQFRNILGNKGLASWAQRWTKEIADWFKLFNDLLLSLVGGEVSFNELNDQLANSATRLLGITLVNNDSSLDEGTKLNLSAELLWGFTIFDPGNDLRNIGSNKGLTGGAQWTKKEADLVEFGDDLLLGLVGGQIVFNVLDDQLANGAGTLLSFTLVDDDFSLEGGTETELGTELLRSVTGLDPFDELRDVLGNKGLASWADWAKEIADLVKLLNDLLLGLVRGKVSFNVLNDQLTDRATSLFNLALVVVVADKFSLLRAETK